MKRLPSKPQDVAALIDELEESASRLRQEIPSVHGVIYSQLPGLRSDKVRASGHSDPTGLQATTNQHVKGHYRRAVALLAKSLELAGKAEDALKTAIDSADRSEDFRDPEGHYGRSLEAPMVSKRELKDAQRAQAKRRDRGEVA